MIGYRRFVQKRALWGPEAYRFPERGVGVEEYRERLQRAGIDPEAIGSQMAMALQQQQAARGGAPAAPGRDGDGRGGPDREPGALPAAARGAARHRRPERRRVHGVAHPLARTAPRRRRGTRGTSAIIISLLVFGLIIGALARLALPGPDPMGILATIGLGLAGSFIGGIVAHLLFGTAGGVIFSILGAILLLYLYRRFVQKRPLTRRY